MMSEGKSEKVIILHETILESWLRDAGTLLMLCAVPWFNHQYLGGSGWIYAAISFAWLTIILSRALDIMKGNKMTPDYARGWLDENFPPEGDQS